MNKMLSTFFRRLSIVFGLLVFVTLPALAQKKLRQPQHTRVQMSGVLLHKEWSKSTQSYCAHKSDYFVLRTDGHKELVLHGQGKNVKGKKMQVFAGKQVILDGYVKVKEIKPNGNPMAQRPVSYNPITGKKSESFSCKVFIVQNIRVK